MRPIEIISGSTCPFAQRTRMVLIEKGIAHDLVQIDLDAKPGWFLALSPYEKVPVMRHGHVVLFESAIINEYLDEVVPVPPLMPADAADRALVRIWVDFANTRFIPPIYRMLMAQIPERQSREAAKLTSALRFMENEGLARDDEAKYFLGKSLSLADLAFYPHLERFCALEHYRGFGLAPEFPRLRAWLTRMAARPSAQAVRRPEAEYVEAWAKYALNRSTGATARDLTQDDPVDRGQELD